MDKNLELFFTEMVLYFHVDEKHTYLKKINEGLFTFALNILNLLKCV